MYEELLTDIRYCVSDKPCGEYKHIEEFCCDTTLLEKAADAIEELANWWSMAKTLSDMVMPKWISVAERLPEEWKTVLTFQPTTTDDRGIIQTCVYIGIPGKWRQAWNHELLKLPVTHWMPLPEPPKEET